MEDANGRRRFDIPGLNVTVPLLVLLVSINAVALWGILAGRRNALQAAHKELDLQTLADARSLEALLANLRGDVFFLTRSPPVVRYLAGRADRDPMARRWARLDIESTLLLFLEAAPSIERLVVVDGGGQPLIVAARRGGAPQLLPVEERQPPAAERAELLHGSWPLGSDGEAGELEVWLDPRGLLAVVAPGLEEGLRLERGPQGASPPPAGFLVARSPVRDDHWRPAIHWELVRSEPESELLRSVETLAVALRTNVALNLAVMTLTLVLGTLAFRQVRWAARLEAEYEQQGRVRELERQLVRSERLASVGRLAAGIAHEINNPLEGMSNYLALLADDLNEGDVEAARSQVGRVREGLDRAAAIIRQVLASSAPGDRMESDVDLGRILAGTLSFLRANPACRSVELALDLPSEPLRLRGNAVTLGQLFLNLVLNACQVQEGGAAGGRVGVAARREGATAVVRVADRGPGFDAAALDHLFEPFYSGRGSTGLGLAVSHGIARDHGGEIRVRNLAEGGAEVEVRLPMTAPEDEP